MKKFICMLCLTIPFFIGLQAGELRVTDQDIGMVKTEAVQTFDLHEAVLQLTEVGYLEMQQDIGVIHFRCKGLNLTSQLHSPDQFAEIIIIRHIPDNISEYIKPIVPKYNYIESDWPIIEFINPG